jgi:hypothetical protein
VELQFNSQQGQEGVSSAQHPDWFWGPPSFLPKAKSTMGSFPNGEAVKFLRNKHCAYRKKKFLVEDLN